MAGASRVEVACMRNATVLTALVTAALARAAPAMSLGASHRPADEPLALVGATVLVDPAAEPVRDGVVLVRDGKIAAVGGKELLKDLAGARTLDCSGLTIAAGFWNSHVHF